ncbi:hypothetical protein NS258_06865 [Sphingomonas sanguinis]|uniref:Uncharacterized protein n=1 Tax=Sphingomonas sanguinis TaxID=33051 RepID=A0A147J9Q5_9SPHN|nr:hypothetical protein NS258_06865 [Sphingomonas sanguinis]
MGERGEVIAWPSLPKLVGGTKRFILSSTPAKAGAQLRGTIEGGVSWPPLHRFARHALAGAWAPAFAGGDRMF